MYSKALKKYLCIARVNLMYNFLPHLIFAVLILIMTSVLFGTTNLDANASAMPLDMFVSLIGIILITPVFLPEQNKEVRDTVRSKFTSYIGICITRIIYSLVALALLVGVFTLFMKYNGCEISVMHTVGTIATAVFLGSLGLFASLGGLAVGYMVPIIYYTFNFAGSKFLGNFYLFSMINKSYSEKWWLLTAGMIIMAAALLIKRHTVNRT